MLQFLKLRKCNRKRGFTLIEMIVVVAIIAILIALLVPNVMKFVDSANTTAERAAAKTVYVAAQTYSIDCILGKKTGGIPNGAVKFSSFSEYISDTGNIDMTNADDTQAYFKDGVLSGIVCKLKSGTIVTYPSDFTAP